MGSMPIQDEQMSICYGYFIWYRTFEKRQNLFEKEGSHPCL
jgi:hypothetical protein